MVAGGPLLRIFTPDELEQLVCGNPEEPHWHDLEKATTYEGYSKDSTVIKYASVLCWY